MAVRKPLVLSSSGELEQLPATDTLEGAGGVSTFVALTDTPAAFTGQAGKALSVNTGETALEWVDFPVVSGVNTPLGFASFTPPSSVGWSRHPSEISVPVETGYDATTKRVRIRTSGSNDGAWQLTATPAGDFSKVFKLQHFVPADSFALAGIALRSSSTNKTVHIGLFYNQNLYRQYFTGLAFVSEAIINNAIGVSMHEGHFVKVDRVGNLLSFAFSQDGIEWKSGNYTENELSGHLGGVVDSFGIYLQSSGVTTGTGMNIALVGLDDGIQPEAITAGDKSPISLREELTAITLVDADFDGTKVIKVNNAAAVSVTVNTGLTGTEPCQIIQTGAGKVTVVAGVGVTINSADGFLSLRAQYSNGTLIPNGTDTYLLVGDLAV